MRKFDNFNFIPNSEPIHNLHNCFTQFTNIFTFHNLQVSQILWYMYEGAIVHTSSLHTTMPMFTVCARLTVLKLKDFPHSISLFTNQFTMPLLWTLWKPVIFQKVCWHMFMLSTYPLANYLSRFSPHPSSFCIWLVTHSRVHCPPHPFDTHHSVFSFTKF